MIREVPMYQAVCDACGSTDNEGEYWAWADPDQAVEVGIASEWQQFGTGSRTILCCPACIVYDEERDEYVPKESIAMRPLWTEEKGRNEYRYRVIRVEWVRDKCVVNVELEIADTPSKMSSPPQRLFFQFREVSMLPSVGTFVTVTMDWPNGSPAR